jgi:hypothetical protein
MSKPEAPQRKPRCEFISKTGQRCHADPQTGKDWCFFHDPEKKQKQAEAQKQGGETRSRQTDPAITLPPNLPVMPLEKFSDVLHLLEQTVNHLRQGEMDVTAARAVGYLAGLLQRSIKANAQPMVSTLADTINQFRRAEMDLRTAKTIGHLTALMLNALKQEAQQQKMADMMAGGRASETSQWSPTILREAPSHDRMETAVTPIIAARELEQLHPAVINGNAVNATDRGGVRIP